MKRENFKLASGRNLEYITNGPTQGSAVILHAGTTQDITGWPTWLDYFKSQEVYALSFARSGYSASGVMPGRITIDVAKDISELCDFLGISEFVSIGLSGGGQHAIATGLDPRCKGVIAVGSLAPFAELVEGFYTGMQQADLDEYADAIKDIKLIVARFQKWQAGDAVGFNSSFAPSKSIGPIT
jgi:pimeloyl-ACP methyl ester carboxylesterase